MTLDKVTMTVLERKLDSIAREMGVIMRRAARSPIFSQSHDFSCFIGDAQGQLISIAEGIPVHTGGGAMTLMGCPWCPPWPPVATAPRFLSVPSL